MRANGLIIILANYFRCHPGQQIDQPEPVGSLMQLWVESGRGRIWCNDEEIVLRPGMVSLLPWGRRMRYEADRRRPFMLAGIHMIPERSDSERAVEAPLGAIPGMESSAAPMGLPPVDDAVIRTWRSGGAWQLWSQACIAMHQADRAGEAVGARASHRAAAHGLLPHWYQALAGPDLGDDWVGALIRDLVERDPRRRWTLNDLIRASGVSIATLARATRAVHDLAPLAYLRRVKLASACQDLLSSSDTLTAIAERYGFADPGHFSRRFKQVYGVSPSRWRQRASSW